MIQSMFMLLGTLMSISHVRGTLHAQDFKNIFSSNFLTHLINKPTRVSEHSATSIDKFVVMSWK